LKPPLALQVALTAAKRREDTSRAYSGEALRIYKSRLTVAKHPHYNPVTHITPSLYANNPKSQLQNCVNTDISTVKSPCVSAIMA